MYNFNDAKTEVFNNLSTHEDVKVVQKSLLDKKFHEFEEVWQIEKEVSDANDGCLKLNFYLCFRNSFPLTIPSLYLDKASYDLVKYIPHIDSNHLICTFDSETTRTNPNYPYGIVLFCLKQAREIIENGLKKRNLKDFEEEFLSYWECKYEERTKVNQEVISLIEVDPDESQIRLFKLEKKLGCYSYIIYQKTEENERFLKFLEGAGYKYKESEIFFAGQLSIPNNPPFDISNKNAIEKVKAISEEKYKEFIKKINGSGRLLVLFRKIINGRTFYLGWFHSFPNLSINGFRKGKLKALDVLTKLPQSAEKVERVSPEIYTTFRINERTRGVNNIEKFSFLIAGVGSIGSNLLHFLNSLSYPEFRLIDYETVAIENIGRHLLGISYINIHKTIAAKDYLQSINPKQNVLTKELSLIEVLENDKSFIDAADFLFIVIGKLNIENWVAKKIQTGDIAKPTFIIWVEPYLAGGHCIYIHPNDYKYNEFYHAYGDNIFFNGNVIHDKEYLKEKALLTLKDAGCQTSFTPYSGSNVILFLSSLYPHLLKIIREKRDNSCCLSWIGDKDMLVKLEIELSEFGNKYKSFELIEYGI